MRGVGIWSRFSQKASSRACSCQLFWKSKELKQLRNYGGLKDKDRIFTNLYGEYDWGLPGALKRVHCALVFLFIVEIFSLFRGTGIERKI